MRRLRLTVLLATLALATGSFPAPGLAADESAEPTPSETSAPTGDETFDEVAMPEPRTKGETSEARGLIVRWDAKTIKATERLATVKRSLGKSVTVSRKMSSGADLYLFEDPAGTLTTAEVRTALKSLRKTKGVKSADADVLITALATPTDPYYGSYQWDMWQGPANGTSGMNLPGAWDRTRGDGVVVAVLDTGLTAHSDLSGRILAGYDFIDDPATANDGDGRDGDASDPGDWCQGGTSSWHGTHVSGTIAAVMNNGTGITGVAPAAKILPVRTVGQCGGYLSDLVDAVTWASGGAVPGVPANPTPARVLNISLGAPEASCPAVLQAAIDAAATRNAVVVAASGNESVSATNSTPGNCAKVITVGAVDRKGVFTNYANYGSAVEVSAPGDVILSTINRGTTTPSTGAYAFMSGTSMATPHVTGLVALLLSLNPALTVAQVTDIIVRTAAPFPAGGCTRSGCGSGITDAAKAVTHAVCTPATPKVIINPTSGSTAIGGKVALGVTVQNWDTLACPTSSFTISVGVVDKTATGISNVYVTSKTIALGPRKGGTVKIELRTTSSSTAGYATLRYTATRSASPTTASATYKLTVY